MGERLNGIQEVRGSIPLGSTNKQKAEKAPPTGGAFLFIWTRETSIGKSLFYNFQELCLAEWLL
jgi:hypothetical protein